MEPAEDLNVSRDRDVQAFHDRAPGYEAGYRGRLHADIVTLTVDLALARCPAPRRVLDVGCGTGLLLREVARRLGETAQLAGVDAAAAMIAQAHAQAADQKPAARLAFVRGVAERLPFGNGAFELVTTTTSFDHWADQRAGLAECRRVLAPGGLFVLADLCSPWLAPTLVGTRRDRARTPLRATRLLAAAGFRAVEWHRLYAVIITAVTARPA
jgi:ubiquinone/menaquinone biosynthesis C-methylase UbiE